MATAWTPIRRSSSRTIVDLDGSFLGVGELGDMELGGGLDASAEGAFDLIVSSPATVTELVGTAAGVTRIDNEEE